MVQARGRPQAVGLAAPRSRVGGVTDYTPSEPTMDRAARHRQARRAVDEGGGGQSEGFELAEQELIDNASHGDQHTTARIMRHAGGRKRGVTRVGVRRGRQRARRRLTRGSGAWAYHPERVRHRISRPPGSRNSRGAKPGRSAIRSDGFMPSDRRFWHGKHAAPAAASPGASSMARSHVVDAYAIARIASGSRAFSWQSTRPQMGLPVGRNLWLSGRRCLPAARWLAQPLGAQMIRRRRTVSFDMGAGRL